MDGSRQDLNITLDPAFAQQVMSEENS